MPVAPADEVDTPTSSEVGPGPGSGSDAADGEATQDGSPSARAVDDAAGGEESSGSPPADGGDEPSAADVDEAPAMPERIHWKPVFSPLAIGMGALADVGFEVVLHQLGLALLTAANVLYQVAEGAALGIIAPSLGSLFGAWWVNRKITKLEEELVGSGDAEATP